MARYIAILRGINVGGKKKILMKDLKEVFMEIGYFNIQTYVQSGNVIFDSENDISTTKLEKNIENAIEKANKFKVNVIITTPPRLKKIISNNPFKPKADDLKRNYLVLLKKNPKPEDIGELENFHSPDEFKIDGDHIYVRYSSKYSDSKLNNNFFENKLGVSASTRNWRTILKLEEITESTPT
ncbi:DUF1697 domain-containing protein [Christiangramia crocea]|uniref:DUF1697 domain-containing protein n=1 Tax=Christiangramia crocea TaxID=2904124 RepID=A0A9X2A8T1_9FLAO|nr:DUF1697 domain-containing protein [Gramella crocea]MCG9972797.1 DUF1697 domain-containing protein [Gramella crocea]